MKAKTSSKGTVASLFSGIGGIELGLERAGMSPALFCEIEPHAQAVLRVRWPDTQLLSDIREIEELPTRIELLTAGFPCQDLSQAGGTKGIAGSQSGLVAHVFRLLERRHVPRLLIENVPFMLQLQRGSAMTFLVNRLEELGYRWAYRVVDARAFGLPQRRERVYLLASRVDDPAQILFAEDVGEPRVDGHRGRACGFYWTEGLRGLGWAVDSVPTLKGGSTLGIPSPPAIWLPTGEIVTPDIRDAERMQGFPADWTKPAETVGRPGHRWKLVGNAVCVPVAGWVGELLDSPREVSAPLATPFEPRGSWPRAAFGDRGHRWLVKCSSWPRSLERPRLESFLSYPVKPLSLRATEGFLGRLRRSTLRFPPEFLAALETHSARLLDTGYSAPPTTSAARVATA